MCGLVGMAGNLNSQTNRMFRDMLIFDQVRGVDSTGMVFVPILNNGEPVVEKVVGTPNFLWDTGKSQIFSKVNDHITTLPKALLGHNRAATIGDISVQTAHPFEFEKLIGMHNGTLTFRKELDTLPKFEVDSQELLYTINNRGVDEAWKSFLGAAALVWWDKEKKTVNFIRNKERDLCYCYNKSRTAIFWASEFWMIRVAAMRAKVDLEEENGVVKVTPFPVDTLMTFAPTGVACELVEERKIEARPFPIPKPTPMGFGTHGVSTNRSSKVVFGNFKRGGHSGGANFRTSNKSWAEGFEKGGKETRGMEFTINGSGSRGDLDYLIGAIIDDDGKDFVTGVYLEIINTNEAVFRKLLKECRYDDRIWETTARCRTVVDQKLELKKLRISCLDIEPTETLFEEDMSFIHNPNLDTAYKRQFKALPDDLWGLVRKPLTTKANRPVDLKPPPVQIYTLPTGLFVNEATFRDYVAHTSNGSCCYACGNPLQIKEHESFMWIDTKTVCCPDCADEMGETSGLVAQ